MRRIFVRGIYVGNCDKKPSDLKRLKSFHKELGPNTFNFTSTPPFMAKAVATA